MSWKELVQTLHFIDSTNSKYSRGGGEEYISGEEGRNIFQRGEDIIQRGYIPDWGIYSRRVGDKFQRGGIYFRREYIPGGGWMYSKGCIIRIPEILEN